MSSGLMLLGMFPVKESEDEIKKCFYEVFFKGELKIFHIVF